MRLLLAIMTMSFRDETNTLRHEFPSHGKAVAANVLHETYPSTVGRGAMRGRSLLPDPIGPNHCQKHERSIDIGSSSKTGDTTVSIWKMPYIVILGQHQRGKAGPHLAREARMEEVKGIHQMKVYMKVPMNKCLDETGKRPIGTRWVDTNKGGKGHPNVGRRLVAQELNRFKCLELLAATPPI